MDKERVLSLVQTNFQAFANDIMKNKGVESKMTSYNRFHGFKFLIKLLCSVLILSTFTSYVGSGAPKNIAHATNAAELPVILRASWHVDPGNVLEINGGGFIVGASDTTEILALPLTGHPGNLSPEDATLRLSIVNVQSNLIQALLPTDAPKDEYALWVKTPNGVSDPVFVNRAEAFWLSEHTVYSGQNVRLIGRNFISPALRDGSGVTPNKAARRAVQIQLVDPVDQSSVLVHDIQEVTDYTINFKIPGSINAGKSYDIKVSNGAGGDYGWSEGMEDAGPVTVVEKPPGNPVGIKAAWTQDIPWDKRSNVKGFGAKGDGSTDDTAAIQTVMDNVYTAGGGVVFLPPGTYSISSLSIGSNTVLLGSGKDKTKLVYNGTLNPGDAPIPPGQSTDYGKSISLIKGSGERIGIADLSLINEVKRPADDNFSKYRRINGWVTLARINATSLSNPDGGGSGYFVKNVIGRNKDGEGIEIQGLSDILVEDNDVDVTHAALFIAAKKGYTQIRNNKLSNAERANVLNYAKYGIIEGNQLHGDNWITNPNYIQEPPTWGAEFRYADLSPEDMYIAHNYGDGVFGDNANSGEGLTFQYNDRLAYSKAAEADATGLTDDGQSFTTGSLTGAKLIVIGGKGIGQIRTITSNDAHHMNIDRPWKIVPDSTSIYTVDKSVNYHQIIVGNDLEAAIEKGAVALYTKNYDNIVAGNVFKNSGGIWISADSNMTQKRADFSYFAYVSDNQISGAAKPESGVGNHVTIGPFADGGRSHYVDDSMFGTLVYGNEYRGNTLTGIGTQPAALANSNMFNLNYVLGSGIDISSVGSPVSYPFAQGVLVEGNRITNTIAGVHLTNTAFDTVLKDNNFAGNGMAIDNDGSVRTIEMADASVLPDIPYNAAGNFTDQGIHLSWESGHAESFKLERADGSTGAFRTIADGVTETQYMDTAFTVSASDLIPTGTLDTPGRAYGVQVNGSYAYVADMYRGLQIVNIADPANPALAGNYDTPGNARGVFVSGNYAYVADESQGLQIIDVSTPSAPILKGSIRTSYAQNVVVSGSYAYVADGSAGLKIIDVSNPAAPKLKASLATGNTYGVRVSGNYAYATAGSGGLKIVDVSNPAVPFIAGTLATPGASAIQVNGGKAYIAYGISGLLIVDVSNPGSPVILGTAPTSDQYGTSSVEVDGNIAYAGNYFGSMKVVNVSDPSHPVIMGSVQTADNLFGIQKVGDALYLANSWSGLSIFAPGKVPNKVYQYRITAHNKFGDSQPQTIKVAPQQSIPVSIAFTRTRFIPPSTYATQVTVGQSIGTGGKVVDQFGKQMTQVAISYTSENPAIAVVDNTGNITGVSDGVTFVDATYGDVSSKLIVLVSQLKSVVIVNDRSDLKIGDRTYFRMTGILSDGTAQRIGFDIKPSVAFTSSNPTVAAVVGDNVFYPYVVAKQAGSATITVTVTLNGITVNSNPITVRVTD